MRTWGWFLLVAGACAPACGRVGYDALVAASAHDAGGDLMAPRPDASAEGSRDAPEADDTSPALDVPLAPDVAGDTPPDVRTTDVAPPDAAPKMDLAAKTDAPPPVGGDYCNAVPALPGAPVIDGVLDAPLVLEAMATAHWRGGRISAPPASDGGSIAFAWRPNGLYVFALLRDQEIFSGSTRGQWCEDAAEVFFDIDGVMAQPMYDATGTRQFIVGAPIGNAPRSHVEVYRMGELALLDDTPGLKVFPAPGGWVLEGFLDRELMGTDIGLVAGGRVGLNYQLDVATKASAATCDSDGVFSYPVTGTPAPSCPGPPCNATLFCRPQLLPR